MNVNFLLTFFLLTICNVVFSTVKSILTIKGGKTLASAVSAGYYGFYNIVLLYTVSPELSLWAKVAVTALCNFVGVYAVKWAEEKAQKDSLWKLEITAEKRWADAIRLDFEENGVKFKEVDAGEWIEFNAYCKTKADTAKATDIARQYPKVKLFAIEAKKL